MEELEKLIEKIKEQVKEHSLSEEYLKDQGLKTRDEIGIGRGRNEGIVWVPEFFVLSYLEELLARRQRDDK